MPSFKLSASTGSGCFDKFTDTSCTSICVTARPPSCPTKIASNHACTFEGGRNDLGGPQTDDRLSESLSILPFPKQITRYPVPRENKDSAFSACDKIFIIDLSSTLRQPIALIRMTPPKNFGKNAFTAFCTFISIFFTSVRHWERKQTSGSQGHPI